MVISLQLGIYVYISPSLPFEQMSLISIARYTDDGLHGGGEKENMIFSQCLEHVTLSLIVLLLNFANSLNGLFTRGTYQSPNFQSGYPAETQFYAHYLQCGTF